MAAPVGAVAVPVTVQDDVGRPFTVDAQVPGVDVAPFVAVLSRAVHGDEIRDLTLRIVPARSIQRRCHDARAVACYERSSTGEGIISVPPTLTRAQRGNLLHEYGHHVDYAYGNGARVDPNGTPRWWRARGMQALVRSGAVSRTYARGWSRSIGEIFAEDYMAMNRGGRSSIAWLRQPSTAVRAALRADIVRYPGPRPVWPAGTYAWKGFTAGAVGQGRMVTMQVPVARTRQRVSVVVLPDAPRGMAPLAVTVTCGTGNPFGHSGVRGERLQVEMGPLSPTTCLAEVRAVDDAPGGASLQVVVGPA
jgi:hypothetical protein